MSFFDFGTPEMGPVLAGLLIGWLFGGLGNLAADLLPAWGTETWRRPIRHDLRHAWTLWWILPTRGHCSVCGEQRSRRAPLLELAGIGVCGLLGWRFGADGSVLAVAWLYAGYLLAVLVIDLETRRVLNVMTAPAALAALACSFLPGTPTPLAALLGGALGLGIFLILALVSRGSLGMGDVKLAGVIGLMIGYPDVSATLILGVLLGGVAALYLLIVRRAGRKATMAYAPYLSLGALYSLFMFLGQ